MKKENLLILFIFVLLLTGMALDKQQPKKKAVQIIYNRFESKDNTEPSKDSVGWIDIELIGKY